MNRSLHSIAVAALSLAAFAAHSQTVPAQSQPDAAQQQQAFENLPWAVRLGLRSQQVAQVIPTVDRVVLVPDAATYLDELRKWTPQGRWPVLIEDAKFAPMFVRRFAPAQLVRRPSVNHQLPADRIQKQQLLESIVISAFGGDASTPTIRAVLDKQQYQPPGVVIASVSDPAWTAAVALAAGHGQPIAWLDDQFGGPNETISHERAAALIAAIDQLIAAQNYPYQKLGDAIDAITVCRVMAVSADYSSAAGQRPPVPPEQSSGPLAVTDLIGRNADGTRYAYTGWIFGDEIRSAYMAMCSLFLPREQVVMHNSYPVDGPWSSYSMAEGLEILRAAGYATRDFDTANADEAAWQRMITSGVTADLFLMNSKGNADFFDLFSGRGFPGDVPVLNQPLALHLIHSWSMKSPDDVQTVGGRWLEHGAYAAVGSCWEPMLSAFVPPTVLSRRISNYVPLLVAARWWDGEPGIAQRWRVVTIGDPLMLAPPPAAPQAPAPQRIELPIDVGDDLNQQVKSLIRQAADDPTGSAAGQAMIILNMLGKDQVALQLWMLAQQQHAGAQSARPALDVFFRTRNVEQFITAWHQIHEPDALAQDMLWHLGMSRMTPGGVGANRDLLLLLQRNIRLTSLVNDVQRLAPLVARAAGVAESRIMIQQALNRATDLSSRNELTALMKQY